MNPFRQFASREDSRFRRRKFSPDQDAQQAVGQDANYQQNDPKGDCSDGGRNQPRNLRRVWIERDEREHERDGRNGNHGSAQHGEKFGGTDR